MMDLYTPPPGFHFLVEFLDLPPDNLDLRFTEVTGLSVEMGTEEVAEGGQNQFVQKFPTRATFPDLVLKRGLMVRSKLVDWIRSCIEDMEIEPKNIDIKLLNEEHEPLLTWHVLGAYPTKWSVSDFNANNNTFVVESIQLSYQRFTLDRG